MNDLPMEDNPQNVQHLQRVDNGKPLHEEQNLVPFSQFELYTSTFTDLIPVLLKPTSYYPDPTLSQHGLRVRPNILVSIYGQFLSLNLRFQILGNFGRGGITC